jgi:hypothetical protein
MTQHDENLPPCYLACSQAHFAPSRCSMRSSRCFLVVMDDIHTARGVISVAEIVVLAECGRSAQRVGTTWVEHRALSPTLIPNLCTAPAPSSGSNAGYRWEPERRQFWDGCCEFCLRQLLSSGTCSSYDVRRMDYGTYLNPIPSSVHRRILS